jgi:hypothetical protein
VCACFLVVFLSLFHLCSVLVLLLAPTPTDQQHSSSRGWSKTHPAALLSRMNMCMCDPVKASHNIGREILCAKENIDFVNALELGCSTA